MNKTPIYLDEEEMLIFIWVWKKYNELKKAKENCKPGNLTFHIRPDGEIGGHDIHIAGRDNKKI